MRFERGREGRETHRRLIFYKTLLPLVAVTVRNVRRESVVLPSFRCCSVSEVGRVALLLLHTLQCSIEWREADRVGEAEGGKQEGGTAGGGGMGELN